MGDVQVKLAAALKRAEEAEGRAARLALDARDRGNKCDALRKRCHSLKDELRRSKATALQQKLPWRRLPGLCFCKLRTNLML